MVPVLFIPPSWPRSRSAWGLEELEHFGEAAGGEVVVAADGRALLEMDGRAEAVRGEHLVRDLERLLEADWPAQAVRADLQEDLVGNVVVRGAEQLDEDLRKGTRLSVNVDRLESLGYCSGRDLAVHAAAGPPRRTRRLARRHIAGSPWGLGSG